MIMVQEIVVYIIITATAVYASYKIVKSFIPRKSTVRSKTPCDACGKKDVCC